MQPVGAHGDMPHTSSQHGPTTYSRLRGRYVFPVHSEEGGVDIPATIWETDLRGRPLQRTTLKPTFHNSAGNEDQPVSHQPCFFVRRHD